MSIQSKKAIDVYADFNCPFCFSLHERLIALKLLDLVNWRSIQHAPTADENNQDPIQLEQLNEEFRLVIKRASDIKILNPGFVPNTELSNRYCHVIAINHPHKLIEFRTLVYRALWLQGLNIQSKAVLDKILQQLQIKNFDNNFELSPEWQLKWQYGDFDCRIPAMIRNGNEIALGLQNKRTLESFVTHKEVDITEQEAICKFISNYTLLVICSDEELAKLNQLVKNENITLWFYQEPEQLLADIPNKKPDAILLEQSNQSSFNVCNIIKHNTNSYSYIPIVFFTNTVRAENELHAFYSGASDFINLSTQANTFVYRLKVHIRNKHQVDILSDHASHDGLTGLFNKREFNSYLEREWRNACRYKHTLGIIILDIDYFKNFNDLYGHPAGDDALIKVANAISKCAYRAKDLTARYGGEEFVIVLPEIDKANIIAICERIQQAILALEIHHDASSISPLLTLSIGICLTRVHADNHYQMLLENADHCLYQAKKSGRNTFKYAELMSPDYNNS